MSILVLFVLVNGQTQPY